MLRKVILSCLVVFGFTACRASVRTPGVAAGAAVGHTHHHHY
jgi:hypothetical protein